MPPDLSQLNRQQGVASGPEGGDVVELRGDVGRDGVVPVGTVGVDVLLHWGKLSRWQITDNTPEKGVLHLRPACYLLTAICYRMGHT